MKTFDMSLWNDALYYGCAISTNKHTRHLQTSPEDAAEIIRPNAIALLTKMKEEGDKNIILTGPMLIPIYLVVFHVAQIFGFDIYYAGKNGKVIHTNPHINP